MAIYKASHPKNLPASFYKPIGQIIARWLYTELYMLSIAWHALGIKNPKTARLLTVGLNAVDKVRLFGSLSPRWITDPSHRAELEMIRKEADRLRANRNKLAHGYWGYKVGNRKQMELFYLRENEVRIMPKPLPIDVGVLKTWAADLEVLNIRLKKFHKRLNAPVP
jgi:hypothetical protein